MYSDQMTAMHQYIPEAIDRLFLEFSEACLSWDREAVIRSIIAHVRLNAESLPDITPQNAFQIVEGALGALLQSNKIVPKAYGFSVLGAESVRQLLERYAAPAEPAMSQDNYADIVEVYNGPTYELNRLMKTEPFRTRFNEAVSAGLI